MIAQVEIEIPNPFGLLLRLRIDFNFSFVHLTLNGSTDGPIDSKKEHIKTSFVCSFDAIHLQPRAYSIQFPVSPNRILVSDYTYYKVL